MDTQTYYQTVITVMTGLIGLCVGSFLNVVIYRLPNNMSLSTPPSHCPKCDYTLSWYDNVPVLSYIFLGGKCRNCRTRISPRYICVEIANAVLWLLCLWCFGIDGWRRPVAAVCSAIACSLCICIAFIDLEHKIIFDRFQIALGVLAAAYTVVDTYNPWWMHIATAVFAGLTFYIIGYVVSRNVGQEALGGGDIKFAFVSGLFLGLQKFVLMMLISSISACIVILFKRKPNDNSEHKEYPFGPFLAAGFVIALLFGSDIINIYLSIFNFG